jgi:hypothetical protein
MAIDRDESAALLWRELPQIRRARDFHLYDFRGRRYLDLSLSAGRALMGHRPDHLLLATKNLFSKGLMGDFPSNQERRLHRALQMLLPDHTEIRLYANMERLAMALSPLSPRLAAGGQPPDPAIEPVEGQRVALWRPFLPDDPAREADVLIPVLPYPASFAPAVACFRPGLAEIAGSSDVVSPALLAGLRASVFSLARFAERYDESVWRRLDSDLWERKGPYLRARCKKAEYPALFRRLMEGGVVICPDYPGPSIVPASFTEGEIKPIARLAAESRSE